MLGDTQCLRISIALLEHPLKMQAEHGLNSQITLFPGLPVTMLEAIIRP